MRVLQFLSIVYVFVMNEEIEYFYSKALGRIK